MILASHVIFTAYGFWLPNDPRGSWSDFVRNWELYCFGPATQRRSRDELDSNKRIYREQVKAKLQYRPVAFTGEQARCIADGFSEQIRTSRLIVHACAILPTHVHMVIQRHRFRVEQVVNLLKGAATKNLTRHAIHPMSEQATSSTRRPSPWAAGLWKVFLDSRADIVRSIDYVNDNPLKEGKRSQVWKFVTPYR